MHRLNRQLFRLAVILSISLMTVGSAYAVEAWNEGSDGDLSDDRLAPTSVPVSAGSNTLTATSVSGDREYITISVPSWALLSSIYLDAYSGLDQTAFIGIQSGTTFTEPPTGTTVGNLLGYSHFGPTSGSVDVGDDALPAMGGGFGAIGFTPPLPGGSYSLWIQQTGGNAATYTFDIQLVPEPSTLCLLGLGGAALVGACRRRRRRAA